MKKFLLIAALVFAATAVYAQQTIKVGATPEPHAEILNLIKDDLAAKTFHILIPSTRRRDIIW